MNFAEPPNGGPSGAPDGAPAVPDPAAALALLQRRLERERQGRKAAEQLLNEKSRALFSALQHAKQSERRLNLALWATGEGIWEWEPAAGTVVISGLALGGSALPDGPVALDALLARVHPADTNAVRDALEQHAAGDDTPIDLQFRVSQLPPPGAAWCWLRVRGRALQRDAQQRALQVTGTIRDVSAQHGAEQLAQMLAHAFASTMDALVVLESGWTVVQGWGAPTARWWGRICRSCCSSSRRCRGRSPGAVKPGCKRRAGRHRLLGRRCSRWPSPAWAANVARCRSTWWRCVM